MSEKTERTSQSKLAMGCAVAFLTVALLSIGAGVLLSGGCPSTPVKPPDFILKAAQQLDQRLAKAKAQAQESKRYDLDETIRALYGIEKAMDEAKNFEQLTPFIVQSEGAKVAPDVEKLKLKFFDVYKDVLDQRDDIREMDSAYTVFKGAAEDLFSFVGTDVITGVKIDREQARKVWKKRLADTKLRRDLKQRLAKRQDVMLDFMMDYAKVSQKYLKEWEKLCAARDRAYLSMLEGDTDAAILNAQAAAEMAPDEKEAHTLLAMALLERGGETDLPLARSLAESMVEQHKTLASAYLLRGVVNQRAGRTDQAVLDFDQAAAYYPKQEAEANGTLNLYKKRQYLNSSKEGRMILKMYRAMMSGAGFFSPDFQTAKLRLAQMDKPAARKKIFDHFFRRRLQGQWGHVLTDFKFSSDHLKTDLHEIFANENIALKVEDASLVNAMLFSNKLNVTVLNSGDKALHNVTLLLCVRFTDMFKGDYVTFPVGESIAQLPAGGRVKLERTDISAVTKGDLGVEKQFKDIIEYGAVLISDELITWVPPVSANFQGEGPAKPLVDKEKLVNTAKRLLGKVVDQAVEAAANPDSGMRGNE